ncbi:MAG: universal stress protein [Armatimonadota bacterium]|nr:universal stress protein [Armatimonadota bacterium]
MESPSVQGPHRVERILAPTDFSASAARAARWASVIAGRLGAELVLLHVVEANPSALMGPPSAVVDVYDLLRRDVTDAAHKAMADFAAPFAGARTEIREGSARFEIVQAAAALDADLIVMGTHGRTGLPRIWFGSVAEHVVRHSPIPVMTVRHREGDDRGPSIDHVLAPVDFSDASRAALSWAHLLAGAFGARLTLLHVLEITREALFDLPWEVGSAATGELIQAYLERRARLELDALATEFPGCETVLRADLSCGLAREEILRAGAELGASVIVMGTHGRTGLLRIAFGSVAEHVVRHSPIPVLTVRQPAQR